MLNQFKTPETGLSPRCSLRPSRPLSLPAPRRSVAVQRPLQPTATPAGTPGATLPQPLHRVAPGCSGLHQVPPNFFSRPLCSELGAWNLELFAIHKRFTIEHAAPD